MSTAHRPALEATRGTAARDRITLVQGLLLCGVAYAVTYVVANDAIAATFYSGYSRTSQAVSELSATGAPTEPSS